jgi:hypothetical protein
VNPDYPSDSLLLGFEALNSTEELRVASGTFSENHMSSSTPEIRKQLCNIYLHQVDPVFKILHGPSLRSYLLEGKQYLNYKPGHPAVEALTSAIYYAATSSLTEAQCLSLFGASQAAVITKYRVACEASLGRAGLITTEDLCVLQAFIIFLVCSILQNRFQSFHSQSISTHVIF